VVLYQKYNCRDIVFEFSCRGVTRNNYGYGVGLILGIIVKVEFIVLERPLTLLPPLTMQCLFNENP
jgi:hypothetical protein